MLQATIFIIIILVATTTLVWFYGFLKANDFNIKNKNFSNLGFKKVLVIFPHPDDEVFSLSGTFSKLLKSGAKITWIILTCGERGNEDAHLDKKLIDIRISEANNVSKILGVDPPLFKSYPDYFVEKYKTKLLRDVKKILNDLKPDLVITYDLSGGYGHPDHMILSRVVTDLIIHNFPKIKLWYTSTPKKLYDNLKMPEHMARYLKFNKLRKYPNFKVWMGTSRLLHKILAVYAYKSQLYSFIKSVPIKEIPFWFYVSLTPIEYFYETEDDFLRKK